MDVSFEYLLINSCNGLLERSRPQFTIGFPEILIVHNQHLEYSKDIPINLLLRTKRYFNILFKIYNDLIIFLLCSFFDVDIT